MVRVRKLIVGLEFQFQTTCSEFDIDMLSFNNMNAFIVVRRCAVFKFLQMMKETTADPTGIPSTVIRRCVFEF